MSGDSLIPDVPRSKVHEIDGCKVAVFDGLMPDVDVVRYHDALAQAAFKRTEVARPDTAGYRHWVTEIALTALQRQPILGLTMSALAAFDRELLDYVPYRAYTNVASYGDMLFTHRDCMPDQKDITALWFICGEWDIEWGGETVFFDKSGEIAYAVRPKPGRLIVFDGSILHVGRPPSRICYQSRYTLAIKFAPRNAMGT